MMTLYLQNKYNVTGFFSAKSYEDWVEDFLIDITINNAHFQVKYVDVCNLNNKICFSHNTYQLYDDYITYHNFNILFLFTCVVSLSLFVIIQVYKKRKTLFCL